MTIKQTNISKLSAAPGVAEDLFKLLRNLNDRVTNLEAQLNAKVLGTTYPHLIVDIDNQFRQANINSGSFPLVATGRDPYDLNSCIQAANCLKALFTAHIADTTVHDGADSTNTISSANATDQTSLNTLLNELKTDYNAHRSEAGVHFASDSGNAIASANASNLATSLTLCIELIDDFNAHCLTGGGIDIENVTLSEDLI